MTRSLPACGHPMCFDNCAEFEDQFLALEDEAHRALMAENGRVWALQMGLSLAEGPLLEVVAYSPSSGHRQWAADLLVQALTDRVEAA